MGVKHGRGTGASSHRWVGVSTTALARPSQSQPHKRAGEASTNNPTNSSIALNDISFDHLIGAAEQRQRKGEAERLRGL